MKLALGAAVTKLQELKKNQYYNGLNQDEVYQGVLLQAQEVFLDSMTGLNDLNSRPFAATQTHTMTDLLKDAGIITADTMVEFYSPGDLIEKLESAEGLRFFVLGPPTDLDLLGETEKEGEQYEQREHKSTKDFSFVTALANEGAGLVNHQPFDTHYATADERVQQQYGREAWRTIDYDWLYSAGNLALRFQSSINNTSLVLAIQFIDSGRVVLFPGDAEYGNWASWHNGLSWTVRTNGRTQVVTATSLLEQTVFYKVRHHLSHNGTATKLGLDLMKSEELTAMATLDLNKVLPGWLNTMPNDLLSAELIKKAKGKLYFAGDRSVILKNLQTGKVTLKKTHLDELERLNKAFDNKDYLECTIDG